MQALTKFTIGLCAAFQLGACAVAPNYKSPPGIPEPLVVVKDPGGPLYSRIRKIKTLEVEGRPVVLHGSCASACTLYLSLKRACVTEGARVGFHGPSFKDQDKKIPDALNRSLVQRIASHYPPQISDWFLREGHKRVGNDMFWKSGSEVVAMGARPCRFSKGVIL